MASLLREPWSLSTTRGTHARVGFGAIDDFFTVTSWRSRWRLHRFTTTALARRGCSSAVAPGSWPLTQTTFASTGSSSDCTSSTAAWFSFDFGTAKECRKQKRLSTQMDVYFGTPTKLSWPCDCILLHEDTLRRILTLASLDFDI